jgi:hypothetical protein
MIKLILASIFFYLCMITYCYAGWFEPFDKYDYAGQAVVTGLLITDFGQTKYASEHPNLYYETNPILGKHPSVGKVELYFASWIVADALVSYALPKPWRTLWQLGTIGVEVAVIQNNYRLKVGWSF